MFKKAIEFVFPTDKKKTPQDHSDAIMVVLTQYELSEQSAILANLKKSLIKHREDNIKAFTIDLEKLKKI